LPVTISPYDENGLPIDETDETFTVEESYDDLSNSGRSKSGSFLFTTPPVERLMAMGIFQDRSR